MAEVAGMGLVASGHLWEVSERYQNPLVYSYSKSTVDQWKQVTESGRTSTILDIPKLSSGAPFMAMHEVWDSNSEEVVTGCRSVERYPSHLFHEISHCKAGYLEQLGVFHRPAPEGKTFD